MHLPRPSPAKVPHAEHACHPQRPRLPLRLHGDGDDLVARSTRSCSSAGSGSRSCERSATSGSTCPTASWRPTRRSSTRSTSTRSRAREAVTRHDVKARIEEFSALAGHEHVHKGMTSRDLTENVEQLQVLRLARGRARQGRRRRWRGSRAAAAEYDELAITGRSHNVAAQATTLGKRFASAAEELLVALDRLEELIARYPLRGIKGPVGTAQDMLDLLDGDTAQARRARGPRRRPPRVHARPHQRRPGLPAVARLRRRLGARAAGRRTVVVRDHGAADGRQRAGDRGVQARAGRLVRHAAQDEHPFLRARQRVRGGAARLRLDGRRALRRRSGTRATSSARSCAGSRSRTPSSPSTASSRRS